MAKKSAPSQIEITQIRSGIGRPSKHRRTLRALGLRHQRSVIHDDTPTIQGMIRQVTHLVKVEAVEE